MLLTIIVIFPHIFVSTLWPVFNLDIVMNKVKQPSIIMLMLGIINILVALISKNIFNFPMEIVPMISSLLFVFWILIYIPIYTCKNLKIKTISILIDTFKLLITTILISMMTFLLQKHFCIENWFSFFIIGIVCGVIALLINTVIIYGNSINTIIKHLIKK